MTSTLDVGRRLVELCRAGRNLEAVDTLYAPDIVSTEVFGHDDVPARTQGIERVRGKNQWWMENHEVHAAEVNGPFPHGERFIVHMKYDATPKAGPMAGRRMVFEEAALYTVRDGKVAEEEFFYHMG